MKAFLYLSATIYLLLGILYALLISPAPRFILFYVACLISVVNFVISKISVRSALLIAITSLLFLDLVSGNIKFTILQSILLLLLTVISFLYQNPYDKILMVISYTNKLFSFLVYYICFSIYSRSNIALFIVPDISSLVLEFERIEINGIVFYRHLGSTCGYGPLPFYSGNLPFAPPITEIELIDKEKGIRSGFKRRSNP